MPTIFILLLFYTKEYKTEKESKKTVFLPLFIWQHKQIHTPFFLLINYAVKKKLQCRERRKGENEGFSFPSSLNIHNISLL